MCIRELFCHNQPPDQAFSAIIPFVSCSGCPMASVSPRLDQLHNGLMELPALAGIEGSPTAYPYGFGTRLWMQMASRRAVWLCGLAVKFAVVRFKYAGK